MGKTRTDYSLGGEQTLLSKKYCNAIKWVVLNYFDHCTALGLVTQSCLTLCHPMDCSPPGSSVHGDYPGKNTGVGCHAILQGIFPTQGLEPGLLHCRRILYCLSHQRSPRILEWVAHPFSRGTFRHRYQTRVSCIAGRSLPAELSGKTLTIVLVLIKAKKPSERSQKFVKLGFT